MKKISLYVLIVAAHAAIPCFLLVQAGCSSTKEAQTPPPAAETSTEEVKTVSADSKAVSEPREARIQEGSPNLRMSPTKPAYSLDETQPNGADIVSEKVSQPDSINDGDAVAPMDGGKKASRENSINDVEGGAVYIVQKGDSISKIAHKHGVSSKQLMKINNLKNANIKIGQKLTLPAGAKVDAQPQTAQAAPEPVSMGEDLEVYVVQKGDSVSAIAYRHGMTSKQLMKINNLKNANIRIGQKLQIKKSSGANAAEKPAAQPEHKKAAAAREGEISHKVKAGEFLGSIAAKYSVKIADIKKRNNISDPRKLRAGQVLIIPVAEKKQSTTATVAVAKPNAEASANSAPKTDAQKPAAAVETQKVEPQQQAAPVVVPEKVQETPKAPAPEQKKAEEITEVVEVL